MVIGVYTPTLGRPHRLQPLADNVKAATRNDYKIYWGIEQHDKESIEAGEATGFPVVINKGNANYADALQTIYEQSDEPYFLWSNDDFEFVDGWDEGPIKMLEENPKIGVLGVHDGNPNTKFFPISIIRRKYIEEQSGVIDMPNRVLFPYEHNYCDDELAMTAQKRGAWDFYPGPCIIHLHPSFDWLPGRMPMDATYERNDESIARDSNLFGSRKHLWSN